MSNKLPFFKNACLLLYNEHTVILVKFILINIMFLNSIIIFYVHTDNMICE